MPRRAAQANLLAVFAFPKDNAGRLWSGREFAPGAYLTDGRSLFRVVSQLVPNNHYSFAALEDCRTLQVRPYRPDELYAMRLRPVRA
jgi:hypothetical protein